MNDSCESCQTELDDDDECRFCLIESMIDAEREDRIKEYRMGNYQG